MANKAERDKALRLAYTECFAGQNGQSVLLDMMQRFSFFVPAFVPGDSPTSAYNAGQTSVVQFILQQIVTSRLPEDLVNTSMKIQREHNPLGE